MVVGVIVVVVMMVFMGMGADLVLVLGLRVMFVRKSVLVDGLVRMLGVSWGGFGEVVAFEDVDFGGGDAAAVDFFDLEGCAEVEGGGGLVEDLGVDSGVDESSEKHVATDAGEAVEVGDAHDRIVSWLRWHGTGREGVREKRLHVGKKGVHFARSQILSKHCSVPLGVAPSYGVLLERVPGCVAVILCTSTVVKALEANL